MLKKEELDDNFSCIGGIGDKLCDKVVKVMLESNCSFNMQFDKERISKTNMKKIREKYEKRKFLPKYMLKEWKRISSILFSFGCCIDIDKKRPMYEIHK